MGVSPARIVGRRTGGEAIENERLRGGARVVDAAGRFEAIHVGHFARARREVRADLREQRIARDRKRRDAGRDEILGRQVRERHVAMRLRRAHRCHEHRRARDDPSDPADDVTEFLEAQVAGEAGLGDDVVGELQGGFRRDHRVAAVRDVGEGAAVDEGGVVFERLHEVRLEGVLQEDGHRPLRFQVAGADRFAVAGPRDDDVPQALPEVLDRGGETEDRHHLGGRHDVETVGARETVPDPAQPGDELAERPVVHVHHPPPGDPPDVDPQLVAVMDVVVEERRQEVVGEGDGVEVAGEMEVDVLHGDDLGVAAAGGAPLHAEDRPEGGFAEADHRLLAEVVQGIAQAYRRRRLALAGRGGRHRRHQDELAVRPVGEAREIVERDLRLGMTIGLERSLGDTQLVQGDLGDAFELCLLRDFDVRRHGLAGLLA